MKKKTVDKKKAIRNKGLKILFLNPSQYGQGCVPLNIALLISIARQHGHQVRLFNCNDYEVFNASIAMYERMFFKDASFNLKAITRDRKQFYGKEYGRQVSGCKLKQTDYKKDFLELVENYRPDIIAVSCMSMDFPVAEDILKPVKEKYKIPVVFGGIHAILNPESVLGSGVCDYVCVGEGEASFIALLAAIGRKEPSELVAGIWFRAGSQIVKNPPQKLTDLDTLAFLDFDYFDPIHFYRPFHGQRYKMLNYQISRGCVFNCTYCVNAVLKTKYKNLGGYFRFKAAHRAIKELKFLKEKYGFNFVRFWDEDFTSLSSAYLREFAAMYKKEIALPFLIYARVDTVTEQKIKILKEIDCRVFAMGIESGNEFIRTKVMGRSISNQKIIDTFRLVKSYGMRTSAYNIIGVPFETRDAVFDTIRLNKSADPDSFSIAFLEPYAGTAIRSLCEAEGFDADLKVAFRSEPQFVPNAMSADELKGLFKTFAFYVRFPESRYEEIIQAETDQAAYEKLCKEFEKLKLHTRAS